MDIDPFFAISAKVIEEGSAQGRDYARAKTLKGPLPRVINHRVYFNLNFEMGRLNLSLSLNVAHIRQSRPGSGLGFEVNVLGVGVFVWVRYPCMTAVPREQTDRESWWHARLGR